MKFKKIKIQNFRVFRDIEIEFSTDPIKNVTLLIGKNGSGKTTLARAIQWCLYEILPTEGGICSQAAIEDSTEGDRVEVSVSIDLEAQGVAYTFTRKACFLNQAGEPKIDAQTNNFSCIRQEKDGEAEIVPDYLVHSRLKKVLPIKLSNFVFFDGEHMTELAREIRSGRPSKTIKDAVSILLGTSIWEQALYHLRSRKGAGAFRSVRRVFESRQAVLGGDDEIQAIVDHKDELEERLSKVEDQIQQLNEDVADLENERAAYDQLLADNQTSAALQKERTYLQQQQKVLEDKIDNQVSEAQKILSKDLFALVAAKYAFTALRNLGSVDICGKDIPDLTGATLDYLIARGTCICDTPIPEGSSQREALEKLRSYIPPAAIGKVVEDFRRQIEQLYSDSECDTAAKASRKNLSVIREALQEKNKVIDQIENISERLVDQVDFEANVVETENARRLNQENTAECYRKIGALKNQQVGIKEEIASVTARLQERTQKSAAAAEVGRFSAYTDALIDRIEKDLNEKLDNIRQGLDREVSEAFDRLGTWNDLKVNISQKYEFRHNTRDLSEAQALVGGLACIAGILSLGQKLIDKENQEEDANDGTIESVPLVMDAPASNLDRDRTINFGKSVPKVAAQLILFINDTDGEIVLGAAHDHVGVYKNIVSKNRYESNIESVEMF